MQLDVSRLPDGESLEADICIVGAGPAGLAVAREFIGLDISVLLLESGGPEREEWPQTLNQGTVIGDDYAGLRPTRHRQIGGTTCIWNTPTTGAHGAKYVPLDPWDLDSPQRGDGGGWPITRASLEPFYRRAQEAAELGPFAYDAEDWADPRHPVLRLEGGALASRIYQFGSGARFGTAYPQLIQASTNVRLGYHATLLRLVTGGNGRVIRAETGSRSGSRHTVRAGTFVLAAGAVENARLLLVSGVGNDMVGRCFMEHPRDQALFLLPRSPEVFERLTFYDTHPGADGTTICGRLALTERSVRDLDLPNASATLLPRARRRSRRPGLGVRVADRLRGLVTPRLREGHGWSRVADPGRAFEGFRVLLNLEQRPRPENRVVVGGGVDALGVPRAVLHWRWPAEEHARLTRLRKLVATSLEEAGLGEVHVDEARAPDPNAHHHSGTTRMADDPGSGAVDRDGRVHGTDNLYVTGASCFPTAGYANPTLTILALALRLADYLKGGRPG
jgi:choline dehydrogenase-like flavoprotein